MNKKSSAKKKPNRKLRRVVRRTFAGILMVSAIAVAAIPAGKTNASTVTTSTNTKIDDPRVEPIPYEYDKTTNPDGVKDDRTRKDNVGNETVSKANGFNFSDPDSSSTITTNNMFTSVNDASLAAYHNGTIEDHDTVSGLEKSYSTRLSSDGTYYLNWQFGFKNHILYKYNNNFSQDTVELSYRVPTWYLQVPIDDFNSFFEKSNQTTQVEYTYDIWEAEDSLTESPTSIQGIFMNRYNNEAYVAVVAKYKQYDSDVLTYNAQYKEITDYNNEHPDSPKTLPTAPEKPSDILKLAPNALSNTLKYNYYCDLIGQYSKTDETMYLGGGVAKDTSDGNKTVVSKYGNDLTLVYANDESSGNGSVSPLYLVKINSDTKLDYGEAKADGNGFIITQSNTDPINAIGDYAFAEVHSIKNLVIPTEIKKIGDYAFKNSFIETITLENVSNVGNGAFKNCAQLNQITLSSAALTVIGAEAFENTSITSFTPTYGVTDIGVGAFAYCTNLQTVDMSSVTADGFKISDWAFYGDSKLTSLTFPTRSNTLKDIGKYSFAVPMGSSNEALSITLPESFKPTDACDYLVSGRSNLTDFTFSKISTTISIPKNMFYGCTNLSSVTFPDECAKATYALSEGKITPSNDKVYTLFLDVSNSEFYVKGPRYNNGDPAVERKDTWFSRTKVNDYVPYLYTYQGVNYYEVSDGKYILTADENGELVSCMPVDTGGTSNLDVVVPQKVGKYTITSIKAGCFSNDDIKDRLHSVTIPDGTISTIPSNCFEDLKKLTWVKIGNSVTSIGASAFEGCENLVDVTFDSMGTNYANLTIGNDAFLTGGIKLVMHGDIQLGYKPFDWAMDKNNYVNETTGVRVCYISLDPTNLMAILDNDTGLVTLVDYPKWNDLDIDHYDYDRAMESYYYGIYENSEYDQKRAAFYTTYESDPAAAYASADYGPWINSDFCKNPYKNVAQTTTTTTTSAKAIIKNKTERMFAWLSPLNVEAVDNPEPYFTRNPYSIIANLENTAAEPNAWEAATTDEIAFGKGCTDIAIPDGIQSIDALKFYTSGGNAKDVSTYLNDCKDINNNNRPLVSSNEYKMYFTDKTVETITGSTATVTTVPGLFSGHFDDAVSESYIRGNDRVNSITMSSVESIPDYAFDSCENLTALTLGEKCTTIGTAPCRSDAKLATVTGNSTIVADDGIIYDTAANGDGTYKIVECLAGRGSVVGSSYVGDATDAGETADLAKTSTIADGAFEDCDAIKNVDLSTTTVKVIPENCFKNCDSLTGKVILPSTASSIKSCAFENDKKVTATIPATEVFIATDAFEHGANAKKDAGDGQVTFRTYPNSAAAEYADYYDIECDTTLGKLWDVSFRDSDGSQIGTTIQVENGTVLSNEQKPSNPTKTGYTFTKWISSSGVEIDGKITADTTFFATYTAESGTHDGKYYVYFYDGVTGTQISKVEVEPGAAATAPTAPTHSGYTFSSWSADFSKVTSDLSVIALYASNGNTTTSTNNSGAKSSSTSSSTGSSSSSSSSTSTSTSTSTSGAAYTVTVVNGSGGGSFRQGTTVAVVAAAAPAGKAFSMWTVDPPAVILVNAAMSATTFTMPASNVTVTAVYVDAAAATTATGTSAKSSGSSTSVSSNNSGNGGASTTNGGNNAQVVIDNVPEISNQDVATALVHGSSDEYVIKITKSDDATKAVESALKNRYGSLENLGYDAMDISLYDSTGTKKITDTKNISVDITIPLPDELRSYGGNNLAGAVANNTLESLAPKFTTINSVPCITFTAKHFSPYTVYVDKSNLDASEMLDATPKTGDPLNPKWFLAIGMACLSVILFLKKDSMQTPELVGAMNGNVSHEEDSSREYSRYSGSMRAGNTRDGNMRAGNTRAEINRDDGKVESSYDRYVRDNFKDDDKKK